MRIAIAIDMPNYYGMTNAINHNIDFKAFLRHITHGKGEKKKIVLSYAFYDAPRYSINKNPFLILLEQELGFNIVLVPYKSYAPNCPIEKSGKSRTDNYLSVKMTRHLCNNDFDHLILVSGDSDYEPLIRACKEEGKTVEVWATTFILANDIKKIADQVNLFEDHEYLFMAKRTRSCAA